MEKYGQQLYLWRIVPGQSEMEEVSHGPQEFLTDPWKSLPPIKFLEHGLSVGINIANLFEGDLICQSWTNHPPLYLRLYVHHIDDVKSGLQVDSDDMFGNREFLTSSCGTEKL